MFPFSCAKLSSFRLPALRCCALTALIVSLIAPSFILAEEYEWRLVNPIPQPTCPNHPHPDCYWYGEGPLSNPFQQNQPTYLIKQVISTFDRDTNRWVFDLTVGDNPAFPGNVIPESFWMVINHGPMPWNPGRASMFYVDASAPGAPVLSAYAYNATHELFDRSWLDGSNAAGTQPPDTICTSLNTTSCGNWVNSASVEDLPSGDRRFVFDVDASPILNHIPLYGIGADGWHRPAPGTEPRIFDENIGVWLHIGLGRTYTYNQEGFISGVTEGPAAGYYDADWLLTNRRPECVTNVTTTTLRPNESTTFTITGSDIGSGVPPTAVITGDLPPIACSQSTSGTETTEVSCSLTGPLVSSPTSYSVNVQFTDSEGADVTCGTSLTVVNTAPSCQLEVQATNPSQIACEGQVTTVDIAVSTSDPDMDPVMRNPVLTCNPMGSSLATQNPSLYIASVEAPGLGQQTSCSLVLEVSDGFSSSSCQASFSIDPCELDCLGTPNGSAQLDSCGVCNGTNQCLDCLGTPFGTASIDRCGVCEGNGESCLECIPVNNTGSQASLDGSALILKNLAVSGAGKVRMVSKDRRRARLFAEKITIAANSAYQRAWNAIWTVPSIGEQCTNSFCVTVSSIEGLVEYDVAVADLNNIVNAVTKRLVRLGAKAKTRRIQKRQSVANQSVAEEKALLITTFSSC